MYQINSVALKILLGSNFLASYEKMIAMNGSYKILLLAANFKHQHRPGPLPWPHYRKAPPPPLHMHT